MDYFKCEYISAEFTSYFLKYVRVSRLSQGSIQKYISCIRIMCQELCCDFLEIDVRMARGYMGKLMDKVHEGSLSIRTVHSRMRIYRALSSYLYENGYQQENVFMQVVSPVCSDAPLTQKIPTVSECNAILECALSLYGEAYYILVSMALRMGLTTGEICHLKKTDLVYMKGQMMLYLTPLNPWDKERYLPVPSDVETLLTAYLDMAPFSEFLFVNKRGRAFNINTLDERFRKVLEQAGLSDKRYTLKDLRNRAVYQMLNDGAPREDIMDYVGVGEKRLMSFVNSYLATSSGFSGNPAEYSRLRVVAL